MAKVHLLGTGAALSDARRTTTMLAFESDGDVLLVDCGGDVVQRLLAQGLDLARVTGLVVTHEHADHVAGFPLLMERLWLAGRRRPLPVHGIAEAVAQVRRSHDAFDTARWPEYPGVTYHTFAHAPFALVLEDARWHVTAAPGVHTVPAVGLRVQDRAGGGVCTYSGDTAYAPDIVALADGADLLVHEAGADGQMHTLPDDAARVAVESGARRLVLVHLPPGFEDEADERLRDARARFPGLQLGWDGQVLEF